MPVFAEPVLDFTWHHQMTRSVFPYILRPSAILQTSIMPLNTEKIVNWPDVVPFDKQSVPVPGTKRPGQTGESPTRLQYINLGTFIHTLGSSSLS